jgi:hypothetical protein
MTHELHIAALGLFSYIACPQPALSTGCNIKYRTPESKIIGRIAETCRKQHIGGALTKQAAAVLPCINTLSSGEDPLTEDYQLEKDADAMLHNMEKSPARRPSGVYHYQ